MASGSSHGFHVHHDGTSAQPALAATGRSSNCCVTRIGGLHGEPNL
ncbi:hypothetical protein [Kitasatospora sp. NPDC096140]